MKVDDNIQKLDSAFEETIRKMDCPSSNFRLADVVENLKQFNGQVILQTMFLRGTFKGETIDNTVEKEVAAWLKLVTEIKPSQVMIYTIDRDTPASGLEKVTVEELQQIGERVRLLGFKVQVSG
jgi:wyosine [tRNA(Phe)-imidazoG37] synthetase (radical SAM superfamily)